MMIVLECPGHNYTWEPRPGDMLPPLNSHIIVSGVRLKVLDVVSTYAQTARTETFVNLTTVHILCEEQP